MSSLIRIVTTLKGFNIIKDFVANKLSNIPDYVGTSYMDSIDEKIESIEEDYVIFGWDWVKFREYWPDARAILDSLDYLDEINVPYRYRKMDDGYCDDIDSVDSENSDNLPEIYTFVKFTYDINVDRKYLLVVRDSFVRDVQLAQSEYIDDFFNDNVKNDYEWDDVSDTEIVIGIYEGMNADEALEKAATTYHIDKRALKAYELK